MRLFWDLAIEPVLDAVRPSRIVEIGVDRGLTTAALIEYAEAHGAVVDAIDPNPKIDTDEWTADHPGAVTFHRGLSLNVLPRIEACDVALIDGDHNWYTVHHELLLIDASAKQAGRTPPVVLLHDVGWPYGRRDLYYDADAVPAAHRLPYEKGGLSPEAGDIVADGFNAHLDHAISEHGVHNGVLTAVEDFVALEPDAWRLTTIEGSAGLGILTPTAVLEDNGRLRDLLDRFAAPEFLQQLIGLLEVDRVDAHTRLQRAGRRLRAMTEERDAVRAKLEKLPPATASAPPAAPSEELAALRAAKAGLDQQLTDAIRAQAALEGRQGSLDREISALTEALAAARQEAAEATGAVRAAQSELQEVERRADRADRRRESVERREEELDAELVAARRQVRESREAHEAAVHQAALAQARVAEADARAADAEARLTAERLRAEELSAQHERLAAQLREREAEIEDVAAARARMAAEVEDSRETMERALEDARAQAGAARIAAREMRERLEVREIESEGLEEQIRLLRQSLAQARADAEMAEARRAAAEAQAPLPVPLAPAVTPPPVAAPAPPPPPVIAFSETELQAHDYFRREYPDPPPVPGEPAEVDSLALPGPRDMRGILDAEHPDNPAAPTVDVVICVHNALSDVRVCLWSLLAKTDRSLRLVVVNDGSDEATTDFLRDFVAATPAAHLIENLQPPHGYTIAANLGLRAATGDYVILLNSDTILTNGWLDRIVECGESEPGAGILGPLSNAASHQSIPELRDSVGWSTNPLPSFVTPDAIATLLARTSPRTRPRLPFINGFCYVIKRAVIDAIGYLDEELFASGYCEENDYSVRAADAGFELVVIDDAYVFHAKSKSFTVEGRKVLAKRNYEIFLDKHGRERIQAIVKGMEANTALSPLRAGVSDALSGASSLAAALDSGNVAPLDITFVLPGLGAGGSGGSHSIYQEVRGLRALGLDAHIALAAKAMGRARDAYEDADEIFRPYDDVDELAALTATSDVISATHFKSAEIVAELRARRDDFVPAYYVQDYEPFFTAKDSTDVVEAIASYTLIPDCLLFAKTHWLCNIVTARHGVPVAKVEPSIDERVYQPSEDPRRDDRFRVTAMIRPRTPRRQPTATVWALEQLRRELGDDVDVVTFGCPQAELEALTEDPAIRAAHRPVLPRQAVAELLGRSDVFLDLSMYQAFGRTALEAMACGATAVVPRLGGVWEFVEHRENAIAVDAFAPQEAVAALVELHRDADLLRHLQINALQTAARYSIMRAALSEYLVFAREHRLRFGDRVVS